MAQKRSKEQILNDVTALTNDLKKSMQKLISKQLENNEFLRGFNVDQIKYTINHAKEVISSN